MSSGVLAPARSSDDLKDRVGMTPVVASDTGRRLARSLSAKDRSDFRVRDFGFVMPLAAGCDLEPKTDSVEEIAGCSRVLEVLRAVVQLYPIDMVNLHSFGPRTNECGCNQRRCGRYDLSAINGELVKKVSMPGHVSAKYVARPSVIAARLATQSATIGDGVHTIKDCAPFFIHSDMVARVALARQAWR